MSTTLKLKDGDWSVDLNGNYEEVENEEKASQDIADFLLTRLREGRGSELDPTEFPITINKESEISTRVYEAIMRLISFQSKDDTLTYGEAIDKVQKISVKARPGKEQDYMFIAIVKLRSGKVVTKTFVFEQAISLTHLYDKI